MPAYRVLRPRFGLKSLLLFISVVAGLVVAYPAWKEHAIRSTLIQGRPTPLWWPQSWRDYHDSLLHQPFKITYTFAESPTDRAVVDVLKIELALFVESRTPLSDLVNSEVADDFYRESGFRPTVPPKLQWSAIGDKCTVQATGTDHKRIHAQVARWRASLVPTVRKATPQRIR